MVPSIILFGHPFVSTMASRKHWRIRIHELYSRLFVSESEIRRELQHRFDLLTIHKLVYSQSYHQWVIQDFIAAMNMRRAQRRSLRSKPRSNWQSTRLSWYDTNYTFWCSSVHNLELYCLIVEKYPAKSNYRRWMGGTAFALCILGGCSK